MAEDRKYAPREIKAQFVFAHHSINVSNYWHTPLYSIIIENAELYVKDRNMVIYFTAYNLPYKIDNFLVEERRYDNVIINYYIRIIQIQWIVWKTFCICLDFFYA